MTLLKITDKHPPPINDAQLKLSLPFALRCFFTSPIPDFVHVSYQDLARSGGSSIDKRGIRLCS
jgi:hypothetical protein